ALGKPFEAAVAPTMTHAELQSSAERLVIQYGPNRLSGTHSWVESPARLEQMVPIAWDLVATTLDVGKRVKRCGIRFFLLWKTTTKTEAVECVARCALPSADWRAI